MWKKQRIIKTILPLMLLCIIVFSACGSNSSVKNSTNQTTQTTQTTQTNKSSQSNNQQTSYQSGNDNTSIQTSDDDNTIVYYVPGSKVYHLSRNDSTLRRSKNIQTMTLKEAQEKGMHQSRSKADQ